jgi:hypothetical protein
MKDIETTLGIEGTDIAITTGCFQLEIYRELKGQGDLPRLDLRSGVIQWERT